MARQHSRPPATTPHPLVPLSQHCWVCARGLWTVDTYSRTVATLTGLVQYTLTLRSCPNRECPRFRRPYHPEAEGRGALPHGEFGLDGLAFVGTQRDREHRSVPEIHQARHARGVAMAERTVTTLLHRYEERVTVRRADRTRLRARLAPQKAVVLALEGLQPEVGHEVLWVIRDLLSGEFLRVRALLSATQEDLAALLREVNEGLPVPIRGVISEGPRSLRCAVQTALPGVPHQRCQFHYLRDAALPISEADRHAKTELKQQVRGVRPMERAVEGREDPVAQATRAYCHAVRSAIPDDGRPPLGAAGLRLPERLTAIQASLCRLAEKGGCPPSLRACTSCSTEGSRRRPPSGGRSGRPTGGCMKPPGSWTRRRP